MMRVHIRLAEPFWRTVGQRDLELQLADRLTVADLIAQLYRRYPALGREIDESPPNVFIGEEEAGPETELHEGNFVHLVWPVAGG